MDSDEVTETGVPGRLQTATIVPEGPAKTTGSFLLEVGLSTGATLAIPFTATPARDMGPSGPVIIGWTDASGTGSQEIFVQVGRGCCTETWAIFRLVNGYLTQISLAGGPALLTVSARPGSGGGFSCPGQDLVVYRYQARGPGAFLATKDTYRWAGAKLVHAAHRQTTIHGTAQSPQLARYQEVSCRQPGPGPRRALAVTSSCYAAYRKSSSATHTGLVPPSRSNVTAYVACLPPATSSTATQVTEARTLLPTGSGPGKRTLFRP